MDDDIYEKYRIAGKIAGEIRDYGKEIIKSGALFLDIANILESEIKKNGADIVCFPELSITGLIGHFKMINQSESVPEGACCQ